VAFFGRPLQDSGAVWHDGQLELGLTGARLASDTIADALWGGVRGRVIPLALKSAASPELFGMTSGEPSRGVHAIMQAPDIVNITAAK